MIFVTADALQREVVPPIGSHILKIWLVVIFPPNQLILSYHDMPIILTQCDPWFIVPAASNMFDWMFAPKLFICSRSFSMSYLPLTRFASFETAPNTAKSPPSPPSAAKIKSATL